MVRAALGGQLHIAAPQKARQPAVGTAQVEDEHARIILQRLDQQKVERKALARSGRAQHQRMSHIAVEKIVVVGCFPLGFEHGQRIAVQVRAARIASRGTEDRSEGKPPRPQT